MSRIDWSGRRSGPYICRLAVLALSVILALSPATAVFAMPFQLPVEGIELGAQALDMVAADVTGDEKVDLVVILQNSEFIWVMRGDGEGGFEDPVQESEMTDNHPQPQRLAVADLDGDGTADVIATFSNGVLVWLSGDPGDGVVIFPPPIIYESPNAAVRALAVADLNLDDMADIAAVTTAEILYILQNGHDETPGNFGLQPALDTGLAPLAICTADFDGNGTPDLIVANDGDDSLSIYMSDDDDLTMNFVPSAIDLDFSPIDLASADVNGDNNDDLIIVSREVLVAMLFANGDLSSEGIHVMLGNGDGTFGEPQRYGDLNSPTRIALADFNQDDCVDAAVLGEDGITVFLGAGDGTFDVPDPSPLVFALDDGESAAGLVACDLNGDGLPDLSTTIDHGDETNDAIILLNTEEDVPDSGVLAFSNLTYPPVNEQDGTITITVQRTQGADGAVGVHIATSGGTATAGVDYTAVDQELTFDNGDDTATIQISITNDDLVEPNETILVTITNPTQGASLGAIDEATVTIVSDDQPEEPDEPEEDPKPVKKLTGKDILTYRIMDKDVDGKQVQVGAAQIDEAKRTVQAMVTRKADITRLTAQFSLSQRARASIDGAMQASGLTTNDFTYPLTYTVTAEDESTSLWTVTVTQEDPVPASISMHFRPSSVGHALDVRNILVPESDEVTYGPQFWVIDENGLSIRLPQKAVKVTWKLKGAPPGVSVGEDGVHTGSGQSYAPLRVSAGTPAFTSFELTAELQVPKKTDGAPGSGTPVPVPDVAQEFETVTDTVTIFLWPQDLAEWFR